MTSEESSDSSETSSKNVKETETKKVNKSKNEKVSKPFLMLLNHITI